jgi:hypothetical protein
LFAFNMFYYHVNCFVITLLLCLLLYIVKVWYMIYHQLLSTCFFIYHVNGFEYPSLSCLLLCIIKVW